ncbi:MAG: DUF4082 domain-containing protein [Planctomycetota bacterium]
MKTAFLALTTLIASAFLATALSAQTYPLGALSPVTDGFSATDGIDRNLGWRFKANGTNINVTELGCWLPNSATTAHTVSLFDVASTNLLAQVTVNPSAGWQYGTLTTPVALTDGNDYCVVAYAPTGANYYWKSNPGASWNPTGTIQYLGSVNSNGGDTPNTYPTGFQTTFMRGCADIGYNTGPVAPNITSTAPATGVVGNLYSYTPSATGSPAPTYSITSGTLPSWLTLVGGVLSGTPTTDGTFGPYTLTATNTGGTDDEVITITVALAIPEIDITDPNANPVTSGDTLTIYAATAGSSSTGQFTITNSGNVDLTFANTPVITEANLFNCTLNTTNPTGPISAAAAGNFTVDVTPVSAGPFSFTFTIDNNDADEGSFVINFSGIAKVSSEPEIEVWDPNSADVANNGTVSDTNTGELLFNRSFTIRNEGGAALNLNGTSIIAVSGQSNCTVGVTDPANTLAAATTWLATTDTFSFAITPAAAGAFSFTVTIANNDTNEAPFVFTFSGHTATPTIGGGSGGGGSGCMANDLNSPGWLAILGLLGLCLVATRRLRSE